MTTTSRSYRLPRWLGLGAFLAAMPLLAQQPPTPAPMPETPPAPMQTPPAPQPPMATTPPTTEQPKEKEKDKMAPTIINPAAPLDPNKLAEKTVAFEMRDKPWKAVLEWLSNETGLPIITTATPTGTFSFYGNPRKRYTIPEVIDTLNEALLNQKYVLIRRDASITIVPADMQVDPAIVPRISVDDLKNRGATEIVSVVVQLTSMNADEVQPEIIKLMGPFREATVLGYSNQLVLQDTAKNLRRIVDTIEQMEKSERKGQNESFSHDCKYIKAREAERILKDLLGNPEQLIRQFAQAAQQGRGGPGGGGDRQPPSNVPMPKIKMFYISVDDRNNSVLVTGPADKIAQAREIMKKIDVGQPGQQPFQVSAPIIKTYAVTPGSADTVAKTLQEQYKGNTFVRISAVGGNQVMVYAGVDDQFEIARLISGADPRSNDTVLLPVATMDTEKLAMTLKGMFQDAKTGAGPYIEADVARGNIIVKGTTDQVNDVRMAMKALGEGGEGATGNVRIIPIPAGGNAATLAAELERLMTEMRRNPVRVINPTAPKPAEPKKEEPAPIPPGGNGGGQDRPQLRDPAQPKPGSDAPVTITVVGGKIIVTSEDPQALALAQELVRLYTAPQAGDGNFEIIRLKHASATDAARIINDAMNGPAQPQQNQGGGGMGFPFGGGGGRGFMFGGMNQQQSTPAAASPATAKVRVIADPVSNSLLVKANPLDMLEVKRLLRDSIDAGDESRTLAKTYVLGPFKSAKADDIADVIRDVYRDSMNSNNTTIGRGGGGGGFPFGGGQPAQRLTDSLGNPKPAQLTMGIQESTNTLIVHCSETLYKDLDKLTKQLDLAAQGSPRTIRVVSVKGIDPELLQQAINALQGNAATSQNNRGGGGFGFPGMGGGGFGGGNRGMGGGGNRGMGGGGGRGGGGGMRFGGNRAPDREPGGPENFEAGVMEDRQPATKDVANRPQLFDPTDANHLAYAGEEQQQQPTPPSDFRAPIGRVTAEALQELGVIVLSGENQNDIEEILKVIKYIQELGAGSEVQLQLVPMKHADATQLTNILNQVFSRVIVGPNGNLAVGMDQQRQTGPQRSTNPFFGTTVTSTDPATSVLLLPIPRFNAILMGAPKSRVNDILKEIDRLDQPTAPAAYPHAFPLKKASASRVAGQIQAFYATRYPNETEAQNQIRITHDDSINTVFVQAAPADLAEIKALIERIDGSVSSAINELRIVPLRNALADELAGILLQSITQGVVAPSTAAAPGIVPRPGGITLPGQQLGGAAGRQIGAAQPAVGGTGVTTKTTTLRFYGTDNRTVESGLLEDVHITSEPRSNSLIISAPPKTMDLLLALVRQLDVLSTAQSSIKIFTLRKADAQQTTLLLQNFFQGGARTTGQLGGLGAAVGAGTRPLLTLGGGAGEGALLVDIKITPDDRTNSIIVAGSMNDLQVIEAIISRLEDSDVSVRRNDVYRLRNAAAADVANSLQQFLTSTLTVLRNAQQVTAFQEIQRNVVIVPEPISNSLLISATPEYYDDLMRMIVQLDMLPAQVVIQVLIADVKLNTSEEFGVEIGLQSPVLFQRSIIPGTASFAGQASGIPLQQGVTVNSTLPGAANPGFNFNQPNIFPQNNFTAGPSIVGFQGLGSLGVGRTNSSGLGGLVFSAASDTFTLLIRALKTQGRVDLLSRPQIMTLDNQTAAVNIGQNVPVLAGTVVSGTGVSQQNINRLDVGINLYVTPRITPDGRVLLRVAPEVSNVDQSTRLDPNGPTINQQKAETTVAANDGETIVIGGLITTLDNKIENKIPWLGDLPVVGSAFRYRTQNREKRELLIILTPHIVRTPEEAQRILIEEARRMDWIMSDVCKVHGPGGLDAIMPNRGGQSCAPPMVPPLPALNMPIETTPMPEQLPNIVPTPPQGQPMPPTYVPGQPIRPNGQVPQPQPGSPVLPATYLQGIPAAPEKTNPNGQNQNANGKESRPWVFRRD
jgi:type II secretion system protein D